MCGILGVLFPDSQNVPVRLISGLTDTLSHRGPDKGNIKTFGNLALGHRRLVIIDPAGGDQPMSNEDEKVWITYNGEMYNFLELRAQLAARGHVFKSNSDTEVVIHAYEEWGQNCVDRFRGMFAFAIADLRKKILFLARDPFGIKPLYYFKNKSFFAFASEIQVFKHIPGFESELDLHALDHYIQLNYIPAPFSIYKKVKKLPQAHHMTVDFNGGEPVLKRYWEIVFQPDDSPKVSHWVEEWNHVVSESVKAHLVSNVPFGAFLSGGIDSSAVVSYMAQVLKEPVKTFSIGFAEDEFNELPYAKMVAKRWNTQHFEEVVKVEALEILPKLVAHFGEPFGDNSAVPTYYLARLARRYVPMVLSGDGGDEFFAGYLTYGRWLESIYTNRQKPPGEKRANCGSLSHWLEFFRLPPPLRYSLWRQEYQKLATLPLPGFENLFSRAKNFSDCHKAQFLDLHTYLPYAILTKVDITSMMNSLEVRTPLIDKRVAELALSIPEEMNIRKLEGKWEGKLIPKMVLAKYFDESFLNRSKMGFSMPVQHWLSTNSALRTYVADTILSSHSKVGEFFCPKSVQSIMNGKNGNLKWTFIFLEEWLRAEKNTLLKPGGDGLDMRYGEESLLPRSDSSSSRNLLQYEQFDLAAFWFGQKEYGSAEPLLAELRFNTALSAFHRAKVYFMLADILAERCDPRYNQYLQDAVLLLDGLGRFLPEHRYLLASLYKRLNRFEAAAAEFNKILLECRDDHFLGSANFHLGEIYLALGKQAESAIFFEQALRFIPSHQAAKERLQQIACEAKETGVIHVDKRIVNH